MWLALAAAGFIPAVADGDVQVRGRLGRFSPPVVLLLPIVDALSMSLPPLDRRDRPVPAKAAPYTEVEPQPTPPIVEPATLAPSPTDMEADEAGNMDGIVTPIPVPIPILAIGIFIFMSYMEGVPP